MQVRNKINTNLNKLNGDMHKWKYYGSGYVSGKNYNTPKCNEIMVTFEYGNGGNTFSVVIPYDSLNETTPKPFTYGSNYAVDDGYYGFVTMTTKFFQIAMTVNTENYTDGIVTMYYR